MTQTVSSLQGSEGRDLAIGAIDDLAQHGLALTPANYEVWLAYRLNSENELTAQIDAMLSSPGMLTQERLDGVFETFCSHAPMSQHIADAGDSIAREVAEMLDNLRSNGEHNRAYGETLLAASQVQAADLDGSGVARLVKDLLAATKTIAAHNHQLAGQMQQSAEHVETLKTRLKNVRVQAAIDGLTGLANRRSFDRALADAISRAGERPLCLILCDIDNFKRINDRFGHQMGDRVIRYVASVLVRLSPNGALAARYGGEEFAIILPDTSLDDAAQLSETLLADLRSRRITKRATGETIGAVTVSIGLAQWRGEPEADLIGRADRCLYAAKRAGRDRLMCDDYSAAA